jgi:ribosomal protein S18 acetylase RimI-like enzyme
MKEDILSRIRVYMIGRDRLLEAFLPRAMYVLPDKLKPQPAIPHLQFVMLTSESPLDLVKEGWNTNAEGFDETERATDEIAEAFRATLVSARAFTAKLHGVPAGAGMFTEIVDGVTELAGITTLPPYRGRGIAAALTTHMSQVAFAQGAEIVTLLVDNPAARRVYERVGFVGVES